MAASDLTTLQKVRDYQQHDTTVALDNDDLVSDLITQASESIMDYTGQEFAPEVAGPIARTFLLYDGPDQVLHLSPFTCQSVTQIRFDTDTDSPVTTTDSTDWRLLPIPNKYGAYNAVYLPNHYGNAAGRVVEITGAWGWPSVPADIEKACIDTVVHWIKTQQPGSTTFEDGSDRFGPVQFPSGARMTLKRYRMPRL